MLFGRRKDGFSKIEEVKEFQNEYNEDKASEQEELDENKVSSDEKMDLLDYLDSLEDAPDFPEVIEEVEIIEEDEKTEAQLLANFIRERSIGAHITSKTSLKKEGQDLEALLTSLKEDEKCSDIKEVKGDKDIYFYSAEFMSDNYARIAVLVDEKDMAKTIAEMVRWNAKTYPCPTPIYYFNNSPYFYTDPQIDRALDKIKKSEEYNDILELTTGNNVRYIYSTLHMSEKYARSLAEGVEFGEFGYR